MSKRKFNSLSNLVYSTNPDYIPIEESKETLTPAPSQQILKVHIDRKMRAGKSVTLITEFIGNIKDAEDLCKSIKNYCGCGGSVKDNIIIIQGDHLDKIKLYLTQKGYNIK